MKGKKFAEVFASLVKTVAIASVSAYWRGKERWEEKIVQLLC